MTTQLFASMKNKSRSRHFSDKKPGDNDLGQLIQKLMDSMNQAIVEIERINFKTKLVSLNAGIEAARAGGTVGAAFGIVAKEIQSLSDHTGHVTEKLSEESRTAISNIQLQVDYFSKSARGQRLSDQALTNVDLIDRNLYERSCDVRWWATDSSLVDALTSKTPEAYQYASRRLGVILDAYTVYYDLVLCNLDGMVVANGRPRDFRSLGTNQSSQTWFQSATATRSGNEFGFQTAHPCSMVNMQNALVYSCSVRKNGHATDPMIGVLGIIFNWTALGQTIVEKIKDSAADSIPMRAVICDQQGRILADSEPTHIGQTLDIPHLADILSQKKGFRNVEWHGKPHSIAFAKAPGFETYTTGWSGLILHPIESL